MVPDKIAKWVPKQICEVSTLISVPLASVKFFQPLCSSTVPTCIFLQLRDHSHKSIVLNVVSFFREIFTSVLDWGQDSTMLNQNKLSGNRISGPSDRLLLGVEHHLWFLQITSLSWSNTYSTLLQRIKILTWMGNRLSLNICSFIYLMRHFF